jgi:hypothetical protein
MAGILLDVFGWHNHGGKTVTVVSDVKTVKKLKLSL